ncbi:Lon family ATP-dependent protease [Geosporobacter ferrireducens]|uniref:endopeptidase La n=1 Tax=Geosporobacter ferrireducens TaxID=1424294 RepID=A0A1D8GHY7_9FIRM|nr:Lon family ATP-dependent protease [Geosporobacter ferrireducens]AOT70531.1 ATP-dependent protease, Lon family [Geosporobacter ferrireducens]MTI57110.1 ATP-dependent protease, Lon family [Geosporobacter ferrireducens]
MKSLTEQQAAAINTEDSYEQISGSGEVNRQVSALYDIVNHLMGKDRISERLMKLEVQDFIQSEKIEDRILALHRIVFNSKEQAQGLQPEEIDPALKAIESQVADMLARRAVESRLEKEMAEKIEEKQLQYMEEMKLQLLKKNAGPENGYTLKKYAHLEKLETKKLSKSAMELFRPQKLEDIVGQEEAIQSLVSKIASPFPQHILIYGPPGVGKTTAARLALEFAKKMKYTPFEQDARFVEVDGTTLRWDPREITNPLLGSVHDPIYQGSKRDLAETGIPEPKLGLVTEAHGGILFIDEIGELDDFLQNKLLKVLEDKRVEFDSAYYDPDNPAVPLYVKKLFDEGAPADFILIGATTRQPQEINPALRSRCAEVFFEPLSNEDIQNIVEQGARRLSVELENGVSEMISQYTIEGRKAMNILSDAYSMALYEQSKEGEIHITKKHMDSVVRMSRLISYSQKKASEQPEIGKIFGLGVNGFLGSVIELECNAFKAVEKGKGSLRLNDTAGSMTKDSLFNAASLIRKTTGEILHDYDIHVNVIGGGKIDGPSAGAAIVMTMISAIQQKKVRQDAAITGEISIQGKIKPIGGVNEKIFGAKQSGMKTVIIPKENAKDVKAGISGIEIIPVETIEEVMEILFCS